MVSEEEREEWKQRQRDVDERMRELGLDIPEEETEESCVEETD